MSILNVVKVGASKRVPQSRIWIEGWRLIGAGFAHGTRYNITWHDTGATLTPDPAGARKVAGTPDRPIIDITGERVRAMGQDRVLVTYYTGNAKKIEIERPE